MSITRFVLLACCALGATLQADSAMARTAYMTTFFSVAPGDEDPSLNGLIEVDLTTGAASTLVPEDLSTGFGFLTDVAIGPHDGLLYLGSQSGQVFRIDPNAADPAASRTQFAQLQGAANDLHFAPDGTLYVAEVGQLGGTIVTYDTQGVRQTPLTSGLSFPTGVLPLPDGRVVVANGGINGFNQVGQPIRQGEIIEIDGGTVSTIVAPGQQGMIVDIALQPALGDYDGSGTTDSADYSAWVAAYGSNDPAADGNGDGTVDAADYTLWRDNQGATARILGTDLFANELVSYALDGTDRQVLVPFLPPALPNPLPPDTGPSNFPADVTVTPEGTLLVAMQGLTRRPDNRGAFFEYDLQGNLLGTLVDGLPPISGFALAPQTVSVAGVSVPEPNAMLLAALLLGGASLCRSRRS